jgi:4-diphosphocytidyl-2-C-methyl-D-erythritol kinase
VQWLHAPAKLNLTLSVVGRRADGYHELESLVAFAGVGDWLGFDPGGDLVLEVIGPRAEEAGPVNENLVVRAVRSLAVQIPGLRLGRLRLIKQLPAAAGLGGGSSDAAAALRLVAAEGGVRVDDPRVLASARATGADVVACLFPQARMIKGIGDELGPAVRLPSTFAVLVNPLVRAPTPEVFAAFDLALEPKYRGREERFGPASVLDNSALGRNDLEVAAIEIAPQIAVVLHSLSKIKGAKAIGMSGSGATCFALFSDRRASATVRRSLAADYPDWWVEATRLG